MGCRCNERRGAITETVRALAKGDTKTAADQTTFVVKSAAEDAASAFRQTVAAAKSRLSRR
jgi:hypothetical protein